MQTSHTWRNERTRRLMLVGLMILWRMGIAPSATAQEGHDGHDHAAHAAPTPAATAQAEPDAHAGHGHDDPAAVAAVVQEHNDDDAHAGHDHSAPETRDAATPDEHGDAGHDDAAPAEEAVDDHAGHDHAAPAETEEAAEDHSGHGHEEEAGLRLTAAQRERFGIVVQAAAPGTLRSEVSLPGEIVFNEDRVAHVVPRVAGIARQVFTTVGDRVKAGDVLAAIDSADLASAKLDFFASAAELGCCLFELPRAQSIHDNALKMLAALESSPAVEQLRQAAPGEMGVYRSRLISAYAEYVQTGRTYERERDLMAKKVSSEGDFQAAEAAFKKAQAEYFGTRDSVAFEVRQNLLEATQTRQLAEFDAETKRQRLLMLGLSETEVADLIVLPAHAAKATTPAHICTDPNCTNCGDNASSAVSPVASGFRLDAATLGAYAIRAPFDGVIVARHISLGEHVAEDAEVFTVVDTRSVWANMAVHTRALAAVQVGQEIVLRMDHSGAQARGRISMLTPFVDAATRSASARVVLDNQDGRWIPGTFVTGFISSDEEQLPVVVSRDAVQTVEGREVIFVEHEGAFEMKPVLLGRADRTHVEVTAGLEAGVLYAAEGAYQLKATAVTSTLDSHAGHGH